MGDEDSSGEPARPKRYIGVADVKPKDILTVLSEWPDVVQSFGYYDTSLNVQRFGHPDVWLNIGIITSYKTVLAEQMGMKEKLRYPGATDIKEMIKEISDHASEADYGMPMISLHYAVKPPNYNPKGGWRNDKVRGFLGKPLDEQLEELIGETSLESYKGPVAIQLNFGEYYGDEIPGALSRFKEKHPGVLIIATVGQRNEGSGQAIARAKSLIDAGADYILVDYSGGEGKQMNYKTISGVVDSIASYIKGAGRDALIGVAGGISGDNVADVVGRFRHPVSVDAQSGLKQYPEKPFDEGNLIDSDRVRGYFCNFFNALDTETDQPEPKEANS